MEHLEPLELLHIWDFFLPCFPLVGMFLEKSAYDLLDPALSSSKGLLHVYADEYPVPFQYSSVYDDCVDIRR